MTEVGSTGEALRRARRSRASLAEVRATFSAAADAVDIALDAAAAAGVAARPLVRELRTARDLLILERCDVEGMNVPDCAQTTSLDAEGPHIPGMDFEPVDPHGPPMAHMHGLDLTAALEPSTRAAAGQPGPHSTHRRHAPPRWVQERSSDTAVRVVPDPQPGGVAVSTTRTARPLQMVSRSALRRLRSIVSRHKRAP